MEQVSSNSKQTKDIPLRMQDIFPQKQVLVNYSAKPKQTSKVKTVANKILRMRNMKNYLDSRTNFNKTKTTQSNTTSQLGAQTTISQRITVHVHQIETTTQLLGARLIAKQ